MKRSTFMACLPLLLRIIGLRFSALILAKGFKGCAYRRRQLQLNLARCKMQEREQRNELSRAELITGISAISAAVLAAATEPIPAINASGKVADQKLDASLASPDA
jgi:DNA-binding IclR family transcriptional regulator